MNFDGNDLKRRLLENGKLMNGSEIYKTLVKYKRFVDQIPTYSKVVAQFLDFDENLKSEYKSLNKVRINLIQLIDTIKWNQENPENENFDNELILNAQLIQDAINNLVDLSNLIDGIDLFKVGLNLTPKKDAYSYTDKEKETIRRYNQCIEGLKRCVDYQKYIEERLGDLKKEIKEQQKAMGMKIPVEGNLKKSVIKSKSVIAAKLEEYEKRMVHLNEEIKATSSNPVSNSTKTINSYLFTDKWKTEIDDIDRKLAKYTNNLDIKVFFIEQTKRIMSHKVILSFNESILALRLNRPLKIFAIIFDKYDKIECDLKSLDNKVKSNTELYLFTGKKNKSKMMCSERLRNLKIVSATYEDAQSMFDALCNELEKSFEVKTDNSAEELKYLAIEKEMNEGLIKALKPIMDNQEKREKETEEDKRKAKDRRAEKLHSQAQMAKIRIEKLEFECDGLRVKSDEVTKEIEKLESFLNDLNPCVNKIEEEKKKRIEAVKNTDQEMYTFEEKLVDILEYLELLGDRRRAVIKGLNELNNFIYDIQYQDWNQTKRELKDRDDFREILQLFYITPFTEGQKHNF